MNTLLTMAEVAMAMAGFSAVVVIFKRRPDQTWPMRDANRFHGMVIHAVVASLFCFLPFLFVAFVGTDRGLQWCSGLLAAATAVQQLTAFRFEATSHLAVRLQIIALGAVIVALLVFNTVWGSSERRLGIYEIGVFWHVVQAALLFVMLIYIPGTAIKPE